VALTFIECKPTNWQYSSGLWLSFA
jgi:hypothetical protein